VPRDYSPAPHHQDAAGSGGFETSGPGDDRNSGWGLRARRWRFGTAAAGDRRRYKLAERTAHRRFGECRHGAARQTHDPRQRHERRAIGRAYIAHRACPAAFLRVMHRAHLAGGDTRTAIVGDRANLGRRCSPQSERRCSNGSGVAQQPRANHPRQAPPNDAHVRIQNSRTRATSCFCA